MKRRNGAKAAPTERIVGEGAKGGRWVFFDGDNTLWHIEKLYDVARENLVHYLGMSGANRDEIEAFQRLEDKRLFGHLGYSATRFATSFENTLRHFKADATLAQLRHARDLALSVFDLPGETDPGTPGVLACLKETYHLALITAGERWVQERRLATFRFLGMFDVVRIVDRKTAELFRLLATELAISAKDSWVVGDSLRSDVIPALDAGLNAVLIANHNWIEIERDEVKPGALKVVDRLTDILPIIIATELEHSGQVCS
jgi:putative hydrolase of the HAD superfamily